MSPPLNKFFRDKQVLVTGHTGFKGSWLSEWLLLLGAKVTGLSLEPKTNPSLFEQLKLAERVRDVTADIRDATKVKKLVSETAPDVVFHLAAQPLVRASYQAPEETFSTNLMGTVHLMDSLRSLNKPCACVIVTTDKCYENQEWVYGYRENDPIGGYDPYSASKGCAELAVAAYRRSFFNPDHQSLIGIASARAGNVIGGGDWAEDRIIPDCLRALNENRPIIVRNKDATRPWQHVLDPLSGYLRLAERLGAHLGLSGAAPRETNRALKDYASPFNFGPGQGSNQTVETLVKEVLKTWPGEWKTPRESGVLHEASQLNLVCDKAFQILHWQPVWNFTEAVEKTVQWYRKVENGHCPRTCTLKDLECYASLRTARAQATQE